MKTIHSTILLALALAACAPDDNNAPPPVSTATMPFSTDTDPEPTGFVTDDATAGDQCDGWGVYVCHGWVAGVYQRNGVGDGAFFNLFDDSVPAVSQNFYECIDNIEVSAPFNADAQMIENACKESCYLMNYGWPATWGPWVYDHTECVFDENGNNGYLESEVAGIATCPGSIDATMPIVPIPAFEYERGAIPEECSPVDCSNWAPNSKITYSYNAITRTHTTGITPGHLSELYNGGYEQLYGCDDARWMQDHVGGVERWSMVDLVSGDFLYRMGFRSGDYEVTIKRAGSTSYPTYPMNSYAQMQTAFNALMIYHNLTIKFRRPKSGGGYYSHTMNLTW